MESSKESPVFIDTDNLAKLLETDKDLKIFDCSQNIGLPDEQDPILTFHNLHIPRAQYIDLRYLRDMNSPYPSMAPPLELFKDNMKRLGVKLTSRVVVYDSKSGYLATRAFWLFRSFGILGVSALNLQLTNLISGSFAFFLLLNGGLNKWVKEGRPTESTENIGTPDDYNFTFNAQNLATFEQIIDLEKVHAEGGAKDTHVLDARPESVFANGHLKDGESLFFKTLQNEDGTVKTPEQIKEILAHKSIDITTNKIVASCNAGTSATYLYAALQHAGCNDLKVYDGSWQEYVSKILSKNSHYLQQEEVWNFFKSYQLIDDQIFLQSKAISIIYTKLKSNILIAIIYYS